MAKVEVFNNHIDKYEQWFIDNEKVFLSELEAIKPLLTSQGRIIEVGIGSGLFADKLGIKEGCDPSSRMREMAIKRGLDAIDGIAEKLLYETEGIDCLLLVTTICFVDDAEKTLREAYRVLTKSGSIVIAFIDKNSSIGKIYWAEKANSIFYKDANFFSTEDIYKLLGDTNFSIDKTMQTVFGKPDEFKEIQKPEQGYGKGSFVVIKATKHKCFGF